MRPDYPILAMQDVLIGHRLLILPKLDLTHQDQQDQLYMYNTCRNKSSGLESNACLRTEYHPMPV